MFVYKGNPNIPREKVPPYCYFCFFQFKPHVWQKQVFPTETQPIPINIQIKLTVEAFL